MEKAKPPNIVYKLQSDFKLSLDQLHKIFALPHSVALKHT